MEEKIDYFVKNLIFALSPYNWLRVLTDTSRKVYLKTGVDIYLKNGSSMQFSCEPQTASIYANAKTILQIFTLSLEIWRLQFVRPYKSARE